MTDELGALPASVEETAALFGQQNYIADQSLTTTVFLALQLGRPLLLEGEAGVGKTEVAKALSAGLGRKLIRLQCYEGLDIANAVYEWNYPRQLLAIRAAESSGRSPEDQQSTLYQSDYLIRRPLLEALEPQADGPPVLLIDELDRADEPFEAYLLEILSDFQVSIPELGRITAAQPPIVVITSNRTREVHDAIRRRCLYQWVDYPDLEAELEIVRRKVPQAAAALTEQVVAFVQALRKDELFKRPGVAETLDWAHALIQLDGVALTQELVNDTLGTLLKYQDDIMRIQGSEASRILAEVQGTLNRPA